MKDDATPDYSRYSLSELMDIAAHVNREKFPERYEAVLQELEKADCRAPNLASAVKEKGSFWGWDPFFGAFFGFLSGCLLVVWAINDMNSRGICPDASGLGILPFMTTIPGAVIWIPAASEIRRLWRRKRG